MVNNDIYEKLRYTSFSIGKTVRNRSCDCISYTLTISDYTNRDDIFFTDNWLPEELKDIPGKYLWIGFAHGRGKTLKKLLPEMRNIAHKFNNAEIFDFTDTTDMLFVFIPEE